ncbi:MAG TPA: Clp protease N-terminal domain-containing protein [Bryobacteraceae bacterium]|nr:Clp protease N-terminal domain-containing protein [Bryobacteraceae bacterium]
MFERYTEKARRIIFFARYEASQFGSPYIETEHLLLGLLREDKALADRFLPSAAETASIRKQIEAHTTIREKIATAVDLPLSHECKRVLAYGAEEAERMQHKYIGTAHLLLGLLREEKSFAAQLLRERGLTLDSAREQVQQSEPPHARGGFVSPARLDQWIAESEARGGIWTARQERVANRTVDIAIYAGGQEPTPGGMLTEVQKRIDFVVRRMEGAIANHEFEKARFYSDEERKERQNLRLLREQFNLEEAPPRIPVLCIEIIRDERFSEVQRRCDDYMAAGVAQVWLLEPDLKRAYTVTKAEGLREFKGEILQIADPPLEMDLRTIFE